MTDEATSANDRSTGPRLLPRIRDTFTSPSRLAEKIRPVAPWLDVLLISTVVTVLSVVLMPDEVFTEPMLDAVSRRGEAVEITSSPATIARWGRGIAMLATLATHPLIAVTLAGILTLLFTIMGRGRTGFREYLSLASHALLIPAAGTLLAIMVRVLTGTGSRATGLAAFYTPEEAPNLFMATLISLDPFVVWMLVFVGFAIHALDARHPARRTVPMLLGGYVVLLLTSAALLHPELRGAVTRETTTLP